VTITVNLGLGLLTITSPVEGANVSEQVTISASASIPVSQVEFFVDGKSIGKDTSSPYARTWSTRNESDGWHVLTAMATTAGGQAMIAVQVNVKLNNSGTTLAVAITEPVDGYLANGSVIIQAVVTGGTATWVEFLVDGHTRQKISAVPYTFTWDRFTRHEVGWHTIVARAVTADRIEVMSKPINIYAAR